MLAWSFKAGSKKHGNTHTWKVIITKATDRKRSMKAIAAKEVGRRKKTRKNRINFKTMEKHTVASEGDESA